MICVSHFYQALLEKSDEDATNSDDNTVAWVALEAGHVEVAKALWDAGAEIGTQCEGGATYLHLVRALTHTQHLHTPCHTSPHSHTHGKEKRAGMLRLSSSRHLTRRPVPGFSASGYVQIAAQS